ncbi:MAG: hypothetical protein M3Z04_17165 [Chloroflexota bacterium]|nr:hypothetical protein [Chloroflexota bacterium]
MTPIADPTPPGPPPTYTIPVPTPAPTQTLPPDTNYLDQAVAAAQAGLLAEVAALPPVQGSLTATLLNPVTGGRVVSADGSFTVGLRPGVVPLTSTLAVALAQPHFAPDNPRATRHGLPLTATVELTATQGLAGPRWTGFDRDAVLLWTIDPAVLAAAGVQGIPRVYTFNETSQTWDQVLSTWLPQTHQIVARTPHFSLYALSDGFDAVNNYLPTINNFETNLQSGTAAVNYPLNLPAGPGGFGPKVSLSYNSGAGDRVDPSQQGPSSVGWGWTLSTSYIAATQHNGSNHAWTPSIVTDGINGDLTLGTDGTWHTAQESFARITYNSTDKTWQAWDKSGTHYVFDQPVYTSDGTHGVQVPYRWMLHTATDVHLNTLTYAYWYEINGSGGFTRVDSPPGTTAVWSIYPRQITWGATDTRGDKLQANFTVAQRNPTGLAPDAPTRDRNSTFVQDYCVTGVDVQRRQEVAGPWGPAGSFAPLRSY